MEEEAKRILAVFDRSHTAVGGFIHFCDFGDAMVWQDGFIKDEPVRRALQILIDQGYVDEVPAGLYLTKKGQIAIDAFSPPNGKQC
jgi:hypothetical protein